MSNTKKWYNVIRNHISGGAPRKALVLYTQLRKQGTSCIEFVPLMLKACCSLSLKNHGKSFHAEIVKYGVEFDVMVGTSLLGMYAKCWDISDARKVFDYMPYRNVVTWNAMIGCYLWCKDVGTAMSLFESVPEKTVVTYNEMIRGVAKNGDTRMARGLFDEVPIEMKNVVTWTVMVDGYASNGEMEAARELFEEMPERNCFVWSVMITGYCRLGEVGKARAIFESNPDRNLVIWNSLVSGLAQNGFCEEAIEAYGRMQIQGFEPDEVTVTSVLSACSQLGAWDVGRGIHSAICEKGLKLNDFVLNALLDMYAKSGDLSSASLIFEGMSKRNTTCWNSMISGFAIHGKCEEAVEYFRRMEHAGVQPDEITFLSVLSACAHGGIVEEGLNLFSEMEKTYGVIPGVKHYGCVIDLLGRSGRLKQAFDMARNLPMKPNDTIWASLLGACRVHAHTTCAEEALEDMDYIDSRNESHYVLLSNIYAASDRWENAEEIRTAMTDKGLGKTPGSSCIH